MLNNNKWNIVKTKRKSKKIYNKYIKSDNSKLKTRNNVYDYDKMKTILCNNMLIYGKCTHKNRCLYAHNIAEQNINSKRKKAYDIIMNTTTIEEQPSKELYDTLMELTKVCELCLKSKCPGGFNCKYGVFDKKYQICKNDLKYGICYDVSCVCIHLSNKGILPIESITKSLKTVDKKNGDNDIEEKNNKDNMSINNKYNFLKGTLLSDDYFNKMDESFLDEIDNENENENINLETDSESESETSIIRIKNYLNYNSDSDDSCNDSIFS